VVRRGRLPGELAFFYFDELAERFISARLRKHWIEHREQVAAVVAFCEEAKADLECADNFAGTNGFGWIILLDW